MEVAEEEAEPAPSSKAKKTHKANKANTTKVKKTHKKAKTTLVKKTNKKAKSTQVEPEDDGATLAAKKALRDRLVQCQAMVLDAKLSASAVRKAPMQDALSEELLAFKKAPVGVFSAAEKALCTDDLEALQASMKAMEPFHEKVRYVCDMAKKVLSAT